MKSTCCDRMRVAQQRARSGERRNPIRLTQIQRFCRPWRRRKRIIYYIYGMFPFIIRLRLVPSIRSLLSLTRFFLSNASLDESLEIAGYLGAVCLFVLFCFFFFVKICAIIFVCAVQTYVIAECLFFGNEQIKKRLHEVFLTYTWISVFKGL